MRRRTFLAVMGAGTLTGCNALGGNTFKKAEDPFGNVQNASGLGKGEVGKSAHLELGKGEYASFSFKAREKSEMAMTGQVMKNGPIDVYVMTLDQWNQFQRRPNLVPSKAEDEGIKSINITQQFSKGDYFLVFDNTKIGGTKPSGKVEVEFEFVLTGVGGSKGNSTETETPTEEF